MSQRDVDPNDEIPGFLRDLNAAVRADRPEPSDYQTARRDLMKRLESFQKENRIMGILRNSGSARMKWAAASVVVALAVALVVVLHPWGRGSNQLYAAAVRQLTGARSLTFTFSSDEGPATAMGIETAWKEPGLLRCTMPGGMYGILDHTQQKGILVRPAEKKYRIWDASSFSPNTTNAVDTLRSLPERADEDLGEHEMDGRTVRGFRVNRVEEEGMDNVVVWVDVATKDPVRIEGERSGEPVGRKIKMTMRNFDFQADLDDSLFDLTPPAGYTQDVPVPREPKKYYSVQVDS